MQTRSWLSNSYSLQNIREASDNMYSDSNTHHSRSADVILVILTNTPPLMEG